MLIRQEWPPNLPDLSNFLEVADQRDLRWFARRFWLPICACTVLAAVGGLGYSYLAPPRFSSEAAVRFLPPQVAGRFVNPNFSMEVEQRLYALTQLLSSRLTAARLIETYRLYPERRRFQTVSDLAPKFVDDLHIAQIGTGGNGESSRVVPTLRIQFRYPNPELAQKVVQKLVEQIYEENRKYRGDQSLGTTEFLNEQLRIAEEKLVQSEERLGQLQSAVHPAAGSNTTQLGEETQKQYAVDTRLRDLRHDIRDLEQRRTAKQAEAAQLDVELRRVEARDISYYVVQLEPNGYWSLRNAALQAKANVSRLRLRWKPGFADLTDAEAELKEAEDNLRRYTDTHTDMLKRQDADRLRQRLNLTRAESVALEQSLNQQRREEVDLQAESRRLKERLSVQSSQETDYLISKREYEVAKDHYTQLLRKQQESEAASELERRGQGETVEMIEPPSLPSSTEPPGRLMMVLSAATVGLFAGLAGCLWKALTDLPLLHAGHLEKWAGLQVLATFSTVGPLAIEKKKNKRNPPAFQSWRKPAATLTVLLALLATGCSDRLLTAEKLYAKGRAAEEAGNRAGALLFYRQAIRKDVRFVPAYRAAGAIAWATGEVADARNFLARAAEFDRTDPLMLAQLADATYQIYFSDPGRPTALLREIESLADDLVQRWPSAADGYRLQSQVLMERHRTEEAVEMLAKASEIVPANETLLMQLAAALSRLGKYQESEAHLRQVLEKAPQYNAAYDLLYLQLMQRRQAAAARAVLEQKFDRTKQPEAALQLAAHDDAAGDRASARRILDQLAQSSGTQPLLLARLGDFWMMRRELAIARKFLESGQSKDAAHRGEYSGRLAEILRTEGKKDAAVALLEAEKKAHPDDLVVAAYVAAMRIGESAPGRRTEERKVLEAILQRMPDSPFVRFHLGRAYLIDGNLRPAAEQFERCVKLDPNYAAGWAALAEVEIATGNYATAEQRAETILRSQPGYAPAILARAKAQVKRGRPADAEGALQQLHQQDPTNPEALYWLVNASVDSGRWQKALPLLTAGRQLEADNPRWVVLEAALLDSRGQSADARQILEKALARTPGNETLLARLAALQLAQPDAPGALESYRQLNTQHAGNLDYQLGLAAALALNRDVAGAYALYEQLQASHGADARVWLHHAALLNDHGQPNQALAKYQQALAMDKDNPYILNNLAWMLLQHGGSPEKALEYAQQARRVMTHSPQIDDTLATVYTRLNMHRNAAAIYEEMLGYLPDKEKPRVQTLLNAARARKSTPRGEG